MDSLRENEKAKYEKVWAFDKYRKHSPGEQVVEDAIERLGMTPGQEVNDYGCGSGRASLAFQNRGFGVCAIDIAENCLDPGIEVAFVEGCLWDLPPLLDAQWGFCADVMEHIPPSRIDDTLRGIRNTAADGVYFQIYTSSDGFGPALLGEPLHLTVQKADWWWKQLELYWELEHFNERGTQVTAVCRSR